MWETFHVDLGRVKENIKKEVNFQYQGVVPDAFEITKLESSCGCTIPEFNRESGNLKAMFSTGKIPKHLEYKKEYTTTKKIIAHTSAGEFTFTFRATIYI
ncbi:MAG: DUF1573 domain-containing protein [Thermodesulfovibrionia bacterium]|nr:DUF1573 domain-containing protein [Thermodesulfovibrionia bacterium]